MIGKLKLNITPTSSLELDLKKVTILLGDNNFYSYTVFNYIKFLLEKDLSIYYLPELKCNTDLLQIKKGKVIEDNRNLKDSFYIYASLYDNSAILHELDKRRKEKNIFLLDYVDSGLSPKDSISLISYMIELYKEGKRLIIRTCNIFTMYYLNVLFLKGKIKEEDLAIYNLDSKLNTSNLLKDSNLKGTKEIDLRYFNEPMNHIHEELFKILKKIR